MARRSTAVAPDGTQTTICGLAKERRLCTFRNEVLNHFRSESAITPSRIGRMALMLPGVRPSIIFASSPTASTRLRPFCSIIATTDGSFSTMPRLLHRPAYWRSLGQSPYRPKTWPATYSTFQPPWRYASNANQAVRCPVPLSRLISNLLSALT